MIIVRGTDEKGNPVEESFREGELDNLLVKWLSEWAENKISADRSAIGF